MFIWKLTNYIGYMGFIVFGIFTTISASIPFIAVLIFALMINESNEQIRLIKRHKRNGE